MSARSKGNVGKIKGDVPVPNIPKFGYKLIELLTHLQVWDSLMLVPIICSIKVPEYYTNWLIDISLYEGRGIVVDSYGAKI